jgi:chemotaxis methyl-accepting protein methylase
MAPFGLVFRRKVTIYLNNATNRNMMKELDGTLFRGGWLLPGGADSAFGMDKWLDRATAGNITAFSCRMKESLCRPKHV